MPYGKVYIVGAGPGHPDLLTIKARELIAQADIIIYDRLIQKETLSAARMDAERIYVGKAPARHQSRQEEINQLLVQAAQRASTVVRLKGGDPVLFGRGGEEAEYLADHEVPFEIVPGVTAGLSVPIAAGIPVTHRDYASSVALVTGHRRADGEIQDLDWSALARIDSLVFFMSVGKLQEISEKLISHGRAKETPVAVIQMAYWPGEQVVIGTLSTIAERAQAAGVKPPSTVVVGKVVQVRERLTTLHRDLRRDRMEKVEFGLSDEGLWRRISSSLKGAKDLWAALQLGLFDDLEIPLDAHGLAHMNGLQPEPLQALLLRLAALGLLLHSGETFQNSEAASRFLHSKSSDFLGLEKIERLIAEAEAYNPLAELRPLKLKFRSLA